MRCPACGNDNRDGARFCDGCGAPLPAAGDEQGARSRPPRPAPPEAPPSRLPPPPDDAPTEVGDGRFQVVGFLGEGTRKRVYLARDRDQDGDLVAVSAFNAEGLGATAQARARREAEAVEQLGEHPHVVKVLATGQDGSRPFIASEYMAGGDLGDALDAAPERRLPLAQALAIAADIAAALEHAHARGIIHRDIKPANVWLDANGSARLGDFGLAASRARSREAVERMVVGTAAYLPPEQAIGRPTDGRADLYSLGALLHEMLAGEPPFPGDDPVTIISRHLSAEPLPPSRHNPEVPGAVDELVGRLLAKSPEQRPEDATQLRTELAALAAAPPSEPAEPPPNPLDSLAGGIFVGREHELGTLRELAERALAGRGGVALVEGEPGVGKTRLVEELVTYARVRGATVLTSACHEADGVPAYWPFAQAIRSYVRDADPVGLAWQLGSDGPEIARLVPELRELVPSIPAPQPLTGDESRFRFFEAIAGLLTGIAASRPTVLVIDDLHWADSSSIELLAFLGHRLTGAALLVVCAFREEEALARGNLRRALAELDESAAPVRLPLGGLDPGSIGRFVELTAGEPAPADLVAEIHEQSGGNPFFAGEIVRLITSEGGLRRGRRARPSRVPRGVRGAVSRRLERLGPEVGRTLEAAAVLGRELEVRVLTELAGEGAAGHLEVARAARIVEPRGRETFVFSHAVFRETLYEDLAPERRRRLHRRAGEAIERLHAGELDAHLHSLARHFIEADAADDTGGTDGDGRALRYSLAAGRQAAERLAHADAAEHLERALGLLAAGGDGEGELGLRLELAEEMTRSGRFHDARRLLLETAEISRRAGDASTLSECVIALSALSEIGAADDELVRLAEEALELTGDRDPARRSILLAALSQELYWSDVEGRCAETAREAVALARQSGDGRALSAALANAVFGLEVARPRRIEPRLAMVEELLEVARRCGDRRNEMRAHAQRVVCHLHAADVDGADRALDDYVRLAERLAEPRHLWHVPMMRALRATMKGSFEEARRLSNEGARLGEIAQEPLSAQLNVLQLSILHALEGTGEEMLPRVRRMVERYPAIPAWRLAMVGFLVDAGRLEEARSELEPIVAAGFARIPRDGNWLVGLTRIAEVAAAVDDVASCRQLLELLEPFEGEVVVVGRAAALNGPVEHYLGLLAAALGELDRAIAWLEAAVAIGERMAERPIRALSRFHLGRTLLRRDGPGDRERALEALGEVLEEGQELGMRRVVERAVRERLEAQGAAGIDVNASIDTMALAVADERPDLASFASAEGRVTILFSDIESSTLMTEKLGDQRWLEVLRAHNAVFRQRLREHGGYEVKSQGDGFMLAFPDPTAALSCAVAVQRDLAFGAAAGGERVRVRIGLHAGEVIAEEGDFFGRSVILAARIAAQARGGEILISEALLGELADGAFATDDARELELKGLAGSHRVFPVGWSEAAEPSLA